MRSTSARIERTRIALSGKQKQARYRQKHPGRSAAVNRAWRRRNLERSRQDTRERERQRRENARLAAIRALGEKCECGFDDPRALQIDHVRNDGNSERKILKNDLVAIYRKVVADPDPEKYRLLCANCNVIKEWDRRRMSRLPSNPSLRMRRAYRARKFILPNAQLRLFMDTST